MSTIAAGRGAPDRRRTRRRRCRLSRCAGFRRRSGRHRRHAVDHGRRQSEAAFAKARPAFECMGKNIVHVGDSGAGQVAKAANQIVTGMGVLAVAEAFTFAAKNGVDPRQGARGAARRLRLLEDPRKPRPAHARPQFQAGLQVAGCTRRTEHRHADGARTRPLPARRGGDGADVQRHGRFRLGEEDSIAMLKLLERLSGGKAMQATSASSASASWGARWHCTCCVPGTRGGLGAAAGKRAGAARCRRHLVRNAGGCGAACADRVHHLHAGADVEARGPWAGRPERRYCARFGAG